jgi:hypothetical protein
VRGEAFAIGAFYSDWGVPDWVSVVGLPLTLAALALAYFQLRDAQTTAGDARDAAAHGRTAAEAARVAAATARDAATAARDSIQTTEGHLADNHLLVFVPRLDVVNRQLQTAVVKGDGNAALEHLTEWRGIAAQVRKLAEKQGGEEELIRKLQTAGALVVSAKNDLISKTGTPEEATRHVRTAIDDACDRAAEIVGERMAFVRKETP